MTGTLNYANEAVFNFMLRFRLVEMIPPCSFTDISGAPTVHSLPEHVCTVISTKKVLTRRNMFVTARGGGKEE